MEIKEIPEYPGFYATDTGIILSMRWGEKGYYLRPYAKDIIGCT
jgi:hypothetical protein